MNLRWTAPFLLALSPVAAGGDLILRATGTVTSITGTPPASFSGAQVGEEIEVVALVVETPVQSSANNALYGLDYTASYVRVGTTVEPIVQNLPVPELEVYSTGGHANGYMFASIGPGDAQVAFFFSDPAGAVLNSIDLVDGLGQAGNVGHAPVNRIVFVNPNESLEATLDELSIEDLTFGVPFCGPATPNSTGEGAVLRAHGRASIGEARFYLGATGLPQSSFGLFLAGNPVAPALPAGSLGPLCVGNPGRFVGPGQVQASSSAGRLNLDVDLGALPTPNGLVAAAFGQTWAFQCWYRDANGAAVANTTNAVEVRFL